MNVCRALWPERAATGRANAAVRHRIQPSHPAIASRELGGHRHGLHYHLDIAATVLELAGLRVPSDWDGRSVAEDLRAGRATGRDHLVRSQGAWSGQRSVRWGEHLYVETHHDGYHGHWNDAMSFDVVADPHETEDLSHRMPDVVADGRTILATWVEEQLDRNGVTDPLDTVLAEGGPLHTRGHLPAYLDRLRSTGRSHWADVLLHRHPAEADPATHIVPFGGRR